MSKINELIKELCPNGVKKYTIKDICLVTRGRVISKMELQENIGEYPVYSSQTLNNGVFGKINTYDFEGQYVQWTTDGANAGSIFYRNGKFSVTNVCGLLKVKDEYFNAINTNYLSYALTIESKKYVNYSTSNPKLMSNVMEKITVLIPPIEIQEEIVRILDKFGELKAELEAELEARKSQYEFWREKLLNTGNSNQEYITLGDIGKVCMCKRIMKNETSGSGDVPFYKIGTFGKQADAYISYDIFNDYKKRFSYPKKGEILVSCSGTIGRSVVFDGEDAYFQDSNIVWLSNDESKVLNKFLYYFYQTSPWNISDGGTIKRLYNNQFISAKVPLYSLEEQKKIVDILERFDTLINDISDGLPAEIELRRKQYEYYRNKLLSFEELNYETIA